MSPTDDPTLPRPPEDGEDSLAEVLGGFPRHLTTQLLDEESTRLARRRRVGAWALAAAVLLFALALPQPRLFLEGALPGSPGGPAPGLAADPVGGALGDWLGPFLAHQLALFSSALALALCLPVAMSIVARSGASWGIQLAAASAVILAPAAWLAGTSDRLGAGFLLVSLLLLRELWPGSPRARWRALVLWVPGTLLWPVMAGLLPAVLMATANRDEPTRLRWRRALRAGATALVAVAAGHALLAILAGEGLGPLLERVHLVETARNTGWTGPVEWLVAALVGVGPGAIGLLALALLRRDESEERPPLWLLAWCAVPLLIACLPAGGPSGLSPLHLLPVALLGTLDLLARQDERPGAWLALGLAAAQAAVLLATLRGLAATDPEGAWRALARFELDPGDLVVSDSPVHRAELARRWGLEVLEPGAGSPGRVSAARAPGQRVVLDLSDPEEAAALEAALAPGGPVARLRTLMDQ
jgi:hypothetical protein